MNIHQDLAAHLRAKLRPLGFPINFSDTVAASSWKQYRRPPQKSYMKLRWHLLLFTLIFGLESSRIVLKDGDNPPLVGDAAEVHNIGYSLAHGEGYSFDWNDVQWRKLWQAQNVDGRYDFVVVRRGSY